MTQHSHSHSPDELDALLVRTFEAPPLPGGAGCLSPEQMAAFVDGGIAARDRESWLQHMATCARCTQAVGAAVRAGRPMASPLASPRHEGSRRGTAVRWVLPMGLAAAAAAAWLIVRPAGAPVAAPVPDQVSAARLPVPGPGDAAAAAPSLAVDVLQEPERGQRLAREVEASRDPLLALERTAVPAEDGSVPQQTTEVMGGALAQAPASAPEAARPTLDAPPPLPAAASAPSAAPLSSVPSAAEASRRAVDTAAAAAVRAPDGARPRPPGNFELSSGDVRWRVRGGSVAVSLDGRDWRALALPPNLVLTSGVSTRAETCWLIGHGGVVVRVVRDVAVAANLPTTEEVVAIGAPSDQVASVLTAGGHAFVTTDGGATWRQRR